MRRAAILTNSGKSLFVCYDKDCPEQAATVVEELPPLVDLYIGKRPVITEWSPEEPTAGDRARRRSDGEGEGGDMRCQKGASPACPDAPDRETLRMIFERLTPEQIIALDKAIREIRAEMPAWMREKGR